MQHGGGQGVRIVIIQEVVYVHDRCTGTVCWSEFLFFSSLVIEFLFLFVCFSLGMVEMGIYYYYFSPLFFFLVIVGNDAKEVGSSPLLEFLFPILNSLMSLSKFIVRGDPLTTLRASYNLIASSLNELKANSQTNRNTIEGVKSDFYSFNW